MKLLQHIHKRWSRIQIQMRKKRWMDRRYVFQDDTPNSPLRIWPCEKAKRSVYFTKVGFIDFGQWPEDFHRQHTILSRFWPPPFWVAQVVDAYVSRQKGALLFVGDLSPVDLLSYLALSAGGLGSGAHPIRVRYRGIGDEAIATFEKALRQNNCQLSQLLTVMDGEERELWAWLRTLPVEWEKVVGPRSGRLLENGEKLATDGLFNPGFYADRHQHQRRLFRYLF